MKLLQNIQSHQDLVGLTEEERLALCGEIREFLVSSVSQTGGHLAGNLGVVELSVAIETVFDTTKDRLVFDVGHQSYVHKLLTGRQEGFAKLRQYGGMSGFPQPAESDCDAFVAGHASSSISIALGMARARTLQSQDYHVIALIGDGALTGGMAYEGLNDAAVSREPMIILLNDNEMSIGRNVGGLSRHLSRIRSSADYLAAKRRYRRFMSRIPGGDWIYRTSSRLKNRLKRALLPSTIFDNMGLTYLGPVDGHDLPGLISLLETAKQIREPVIIHVVTQKGRGYLPAMQNPSGFHGIGRFDPSSGEKLASGGQSFSGCLGDTLLSLSETEPKLCAITAAMLDGTGLSGFSKRHPDRIFDVGIAEEHAISMAGGLAKQGMIPVAAIYSTFLQRGYDQILQDLSLLHLHVILAVDRAGLVGDDGPTHHGVFDVGFLRQAPGMLLLAPASLAEQRDMLTWAVKHYDGPVAIRYPRGGEGAYSGSIWHPEAALSQQNTLCCHRTGGDVVLITYGILVNTVLDAAELLAQQGVEATVLRLTNLTDFPIVEILRCTASCKHAVILEEAAANSGIREALAWEIHAKQPDCKISGIDLGKTFVTHGSRELLLRDCGLDAASIMNYVKGVLGNESQEKA